MKPRKPVIEFPAIVIDTREQTPLAFGPEIKTVRKALQFGDYSLDGYENLISIERKGADLFSSLGVDRERFLRVIEGMKGLSFARLVVEWNREALRLGRHPFSEISPASVCGSLDAIDVRGVPVIYAGSHAEAANTVKSILYKWYKDRIEPKPATVPIVPIVKLI